LSFGLLGKEQKVDYTERKRIEDLKHQWAADPCWDIEETEGFEGHRDELLAFSEEMKESWKARHRAELLAKAEELGCPGNAALAAYVMRLEGRIENLEDSAGH
jgi:hypothetical protein